MGCISSKSLRKDLNQELLFNNGGHCVNHVVSLTSTTYGALALDNEQPITECVAEDSKRLQRSPPHEEPEVINAWELMEGLEEGVPISNQPEKSPKSSAFLRGFMGSDTRSPLKFFNQFGSPKTVKKFGGKENKVQGNGVRGGMGMRRLDYSPKGILKASNSSPNSCKSVLNAGFPICARRNSFGSEKKCPPGGENSVVIYTTSLRGIRKTFEDCNKVRSTIESHCVHTLERDVSMDSGFKEELRRLMGTKEVKVPLVFVKGMLIGGADEIVKLEEEEKLGVLFEGVPRALGGGCEGCAGVRFVVCMECNGSCKVLDKEHKKKVRCGHCNENGIIQCPICC